MHMNELQFAWKSNENGSVLQQTSPGAMIKCIAVSTGVCIASLISKVLGRDPFGDMEHVAAISGACSVWTAASYAWTRWTVGSLVRKKPKVFDHILVEVCTHFPYRQEGGERLAEKYRPELLPILQQIQERHSTETEDSTPSID